MYEILNSAILLSFDKGTLAPHKDIDEPMIESIFRTVMRKFAPDIVHILQLLCLPSSIIEIAKEDLQVPIVMTLQDYYPLCPTVKLFDHTHHNCRKKTIGHTCSMCCQHAHDRQDYTPTLKYDLRQFPKKVRKWSVSLFKQKKGNIKKGRSFLRGSLYREPAGMR